jgi:AraC-like DNA-binding protein
MFYGGTALMALIACIYLCLRRGNAFAADVTPPMQLRRWAAAFFALAFLSHVWWLLFYIYSNNYNSVACLVVAVIDYLGLLVSIAGTLFAMLQDRKRPIWPMVVAMIPYAVLLTMNVVFPDHHFLYIAIIYLMMVFVLFSVYMVYAVRQYRHWLRDNYADLEHKEVWASHVLIIAILLLFTFGEVEGISLTISFLVQFLELPLFWFLLWRVETMPQLQVVAVEQEPIERAQQPQQPQQSLVIPSNIEQLLEEQRIFQRKMAVKTGVSSQESNEGNNAGTERSHDSEDAYEQHLIKQDLDFVQRIHQIVEENLQDEDFRIDNLASEMGLSRSAFFKKLKSLTGFAPVDYVKEIRLVKAQHLIETTTLNITEVAYAVGFRDAGYFTKCFRQKYGTTPKEYRKREQ